MIPHLKGAISDTRVGAALAIGVALHNIPEGIAVAAPVFFATGSRLKAFMWTFIYSWTFDRRTHQQIWTQTSLHIRKYCCWYWTLSCSCKS